MTTVVNSVAAESRVAPANAVREIRVALLGLGQVGGAVAALAAQDAANGFRFTITSALVRDVHRPRPVDVSRVPLTADPNDVLRDSPDVVVELLGGLEPARTIVLNALEAGIPVVTANKSLLAAHGDQLCAAAARRGVPLVYEASVLAGVPFLGTFRRRPLARDITALRGIVNGTSNYILSRMARDRVSFGDALGEAQRRGYAEPDPGKDVRGEDAVEKLCVLLRHFAHASVTPGEIECAGISEIDEADLAHATLFGGVIRPVVVAEWQSGIRAFAGPAFVEQAHPLAPVDGVQNAISLTTRWSGDLFFSGPGAGPMVTAATVLDDVVEAQQLGEAGSPLDVDPGVCETPETGWFVTLTASALADETEAPRMLGTLGARVRRASAIDRRDGGVRQWLLIAPCARAHIDAALGIVDAKLGCATRAIRVLE